MFAEISFTENYREKSGMVDNAYEYITAKGWQYRDTGKEMVLKTCPYCGASDWKFSINSNSGVWLCNHENSCGERGNLWKLQRDMGDLTPVTRRPVVPPPQRKFETETEKFLKWYEEKRGIAIPILKKYGVKLFKSNGNKFIAYETITAEGEIVNRKFRNVADKKNMWVEKDASLAYYGQQFLNFKNTTLIVTEGEDDCHALAQCEIENVVSIPQGVMAYTPEMDKLNNRFEKIVVIFDNDDKGQQGARRFAEKAGLAKCVNVVLPYKDSRDCLLNGFNIFTFQKYIGNAERFRYERILSQKDSFSLFINDMYHNRTDSINVATAGINRVLGGIRRKELTVITGHSGQGKSTFAYNFAHWAEKAGMSVFNMSFENKLSSVVRKYIEIDTDRCFFEYSEDDNKYQRVITEQEAMGFQYDYELRNLYHFDKSYSQTGFFTVEDVLESIKYANKFYNCDFVVVDHLHYFLRLSTERNPADKIAETIRALSVLAQEMNIHILLISHPHKPNDRNGKLEELTMNSGKGSSSIVQEADNYMIVSRPETQNDMNYSIVRIVKNRENGRLGKMAFLVSENGNTFTETANYNWNDDGKGKNISIPR